MIRVVLADDHDLFIQGLTALLSQEKDIEIVQKVSDGQDLLAYLGEEEADVVLLDINMPNLNGIEASKKILIQHPKTRIIIVTMLDKDLVIEELIEMGVHGYLVKNADKHDLLSAIRTVAKGKRFFSTEITLKLLSGRTKQTNKTFTLTKREREIIGLICKGHTTLEIADLLYVSKFTIDSHRKNILGKTGCRNATQLMNWARNNGLL